MLLKGKKIFIGLVLVVAFLLATVLMTSSINIFSLSEGVNINYSDLINKIKLSNASKFLTSKDVLRLVNYFYEYQKLRANIKNLSYEELNRFLFLGNYLSGYLDPNYIGMTKNALDDVLSRYQEIADQKVIDGVAEKLNDKVLLLKKVNELKMNVRKLYDADKISKASYEEIMDKLGDIEYNINLSELSFGSIKLDLKDIINAINKEKKSYSKSVDLSFFEDVESNISMIQSEINGLEYISNFVNNSINVIGGSGQLPIGVSSKTNYERFSEIANNIDTKTLSNVVEVLEGDLSSTKLESIDFAKTMKFPNITIEGSIEDAWDLNVDVSSLNLNNLLAPVDLSLVSGDSVHKLLKGITNVKVPGINWGEGDLISPMPIDVPTTIPTVVPTVSPTEVPTAKPIETLPITPDAGDHEGIVSSEETITPSPNVSENPSVPSIRLNYKIVAGLGIVVIGVVLFWRIKGDKISVKRQIVYKGNDGLKHMQSNIEKVPINYKEKLISLGTQMLYRISSINAKDRKEKTPREVVKGFSSKGKCDLGVLENFLKYYECAVFYKIDVDEKLYQEFVVICDKICNTLKPEEEGIK